MFNLDFIFKPKSIAIVGASAEVGSVGNGLVKNVLQTFSGPTYLINLKAKKINGQKCYPNLSSVAKKIDLVIIAVPAKVVPDVLNEAGSLGVKGAIVISAGFKEAGNLDLEEKIKEIAKRYNITLVGPNCLGIINPVSSLNASFAAVNPKSGSVAFVSQSGALCTGVLDLAEKLGIGFSKFMSIGNKALVDETMVLEYLAKDKQTKIIALYVEQLNDAKRLLSLFKKIGRGKLAKPIIVIKAGSTSAGASASASHTGALAGNDAVYNALFKQGGVIRANNIEEMFEYLQIFNNNPIKKADNLAIITNAGGLGVLAIDAISKANLQVAKLSKNTINNLKKNLPLAANCHNPVDVLGDAKADRYQMALDNVLGDKSVSAAIVILTPQSMTQVLETAKEIVKAKVKYKKPLAAVFLGESLVLEAISFLKKNQVVTYLYPESAIKSLAQLNSCFKFSQTKEEKIIRFSDVKKKEVEKILLENKFISENVALKILQAYGLPTISSFVVNSEAEAEKVAKKIGKKMVFKIVSPDILHKSDCGGVELNVLPEMASSKYQELLKRVLKNKPKAKINGILIEEMIEEKGIEMILGAALDKSLGSTLMLGLGGIYVEVLKDVSLALNPVSKNEALAMINNLKSSKLLDGFRGQGALDKKALLDCLLRLSQLLQDFPQIAELDINPLLVSSQGVKVLDARIILK